MMLYTLKVVVISILAFIVVKTHIAMLVIHSPVGIWLSN